MEAARFRVPIAFGLVLVGLLSAYAPARASGPGPVAGRPVPPAAFASSTWGVVDRNTFGSPTAILRAGPYSRRAPTDMAATVPPPYGIGSVGITVGSITEKVFFGNETDFAGIPLRDVNVLKYWVYAGVDSLVGVALPNISIEVDPTIGTSTFASLNYVPDTSAVPSAPPARLTNTWQQYDASAAGSRWYSTGSTGTLINCTIVSPCSFNVLKQRLPDAVISSALGISTGRNTVFLGAVDGLQVNNTVYDFEHFGVRKTVPLP
jgi:hypothetical protein